MAQVCVSVMGLEDGSIQHDVCIRSLTDSAHALQQEERLSLARKACSNSQPTTGVKTAECELKFSRTVALHPAPYDNNPALGKTKATTSYFHTAFAEARGREQQACVELGIAPDNPIFEGCVINLDASLSSFSNAASGGE